MAEKAPAKAPFIEKVVADAASPPRIRMLSGYVGSSSEKDCLRLYSDPELSHYLEIPTAAVRHSEPVDGDSLGAVHLWVDRDADIIRRGENTVESRGRFLEGTVARGQADQPQPDVPQPGVPQPRAPQSLVDGCPSRFQFCGPPRSLVIDGCGGNSIFACPPSRFDICQSFVDACPSRFGCPTLPDSGCVRTVLPECPPSQFLICQSDPRICVDPITRNVQCPSLIACPSRVVVCQSAVDACPSEQQICITRAANCESQFQLCQGVTRNIACQSEVDACPTRICDFPVTRNAQFCGGGGAQPSLVDGCASSLGCTAAACIDPGLGGAIDPGRFGMRPRFRGF